MQESKELFLRLRLGVLKQVLCDLMEQILELETIITSNDYNISLDDYTTAEEELKVFLTVIQEPLNIYLEGSVCPDNKFLEFKKKHKL